MKQKKHTKRALCMSILSMLLCCSMLVGTTFAWFTDSVTSGKNKIVAGNLDVELYHGEGITDDNKVTKDTQLFNKAIDGTPILWEPGVIVYESFTVKNEGSLALKYKLELDELEKNFVVEPDPSSLGEKKTTERSLTDVIKVAVTTEAVTRDSVKTMTFMGLDEFDALTGALMPKDKSGDSASFNVVLYWAPTVDDDLYNLKNGLTASDFKEAHATALNIEFGVSLTASQYTYESDSFDDQYDVGATDGSGKVIVLTSESKSVAGDEAFTFSMPGNTVTGEGALTAQFPKGSLASAAAHTVELIAETQKPYDGEESDPTKQAIANVELTLLVDDIEVHTFNGRTVTVTTYIPANLFNVEVVYKGTPDELLTGTIYDKTTGKLTFQTNHFSLFEIRADLLMSEEEEQQAANGMKFRFGDEYYANLDEFAKANYEKKATVTMEDGQLFKFLTDTEIDRTLILGLNVTTATVDLGGHSVTFLRKDGETRDALCFKVPDGTKNCGTVTFQNGTINGWNQGSTNAPIHCEWYGSFKLKNLTINNLGSTSTLKDEPYAVTCETNKGDESYIDDCVINGDVRCDSKSTIHIANTVINGDLEGATDGRIYLENVTVNGEVQNKGYSKSTFYIKSGHFKVLPGINYYTLEEGSTATYNESTGMWDVVAG